MNDIICRETADSNRLMSALGIETSMLAPVLSTRGFGLNIVSDRRFQGAVSLSKLPPHQVERVRAAARVQPPGSSMESGVYFFNDGGEILFADGNEIADS